MLIRISIVFVLYRPRPHQRSNPESSVKLKLCMDHRTLIVDHSASVITLPMTG